MRRDQDAKKHLPKAEKITIKKNKKSNITKFKLRTSKYLITLKVDGRSRAEKIKQSIPAGKSLLATHLRMVLLTMKCLFRPQEGIKGMIKSSLLEFNIVPLIHFFDLQKTFLAMMYSLMIVWRPNEWSKAFY